MISNWFKVSLKNGSVAFIRQWHINKTDKQIGSACELSQVFVWIHIVWIRALCDSSFVPIIQPAIKVFVGHVKCKHSRSTNKNQHKNITTKPCRAWPTHLSMCVCRIATHLFSRCVIQAWHICQNRSNRYIASPSLCGATRFWWATGGIPVCGDGIWMCCVGQA